jgi:hypothetical protein
MFSNFSGLYLVFGIFLRVAGEQGVEGLKRLDPSGAREIRGVVYAFTAGDCWYFGALQSIGIIAAVNDSPIYDCRFDGSGNLYVSAWNQGTIFKFDSSGNNKTTFASGPSGIESLAFDSHGNLYASMDNFLGKGSIEKFAPDGGTGTVFASSASLNSPFGIAFDGSDNLYVACYGGNSIVKLDPGGNMSTVASVQNTLGIAIQIPEPCTLLLLGLGAAILRRKSS